MDNLELLKEIQAQLKLLREDFKYSQVPSGGWDRLLHLEQIVSNQTGFQTGTVEDLADLATLVNEKIRQETAGFIKSGHQIGAIKHLREAFEADTGRKIRLPVAKHYCDALRDEMRHQGITIEARI